LVGYQSKGNSLADPRIVCKSSQCLVLKILDLCTPLLHYQHSNHYYLCTRNPILCPGRSELYLLIVLVDL
jgi:hypothetical protein